MTVPNGRIGRGYSVAFAIGTIGAGLSLPNLIVYLITIADFDPVAAGATTAAAAVARLALVIPAAALAQRLGANRSTILSSTLAAVTLVGMVLGHAHPGLVVFFFLLNVLPERVYWAAWPVFVEDLVGAGNLGRGLADANAVKNVGLIAGSAAGLLTLMFADDGALLVLLAVSGAASLASGLVQAWLTRGRRRLSPPSPPPAVADGREDAPRTGMWLAVGHFGGIRFVNSALTFVESTYLVGVHGFPAWLPSATFFIAAMSPIVLRAPLTRGATPEGARRVLSGQLALTTAAVVITAACTAFPVTALLTAAAVVAGVARGTSDNISGSMAYLAVQSTSAAPLSSHRIGVLELAYTAAQFGSRMLAWSLPVIALPVALTLAALVGTTAVLSRRLSRSGHRSLSQPTATDDQAALTSRRAPGSR